VKQARIGEMERSLGGLSHFYLLAGPFQQGEKADRDGGGPDTAAC